MKKAVATVDWRTQAEDKPASGSKPAGLTQARFWSKCLGRVGFSWLSPSRHCIQDYNRWENNIVQTAGTAAAQTAFMCVLLAAFDMLAASRTVSFTLTLTPLGSGMLVGMRINASMWLGMILAWIVAPYALLQYQVLGEGFTRNDVLFWVMWPATGMMVSAGLAALVLRWKMSKPSANCRRATSARTAFRSDGWRAGRR
jgi:uncharacterized oligopeptide transporter (OPT) family protein